MSEFMLYTDEHLWSSSVVFHERRRCMQWEHSARLSFQFCAPLAWWPAAVIILLWSVEPAVFILMYLFIGGGLA